MKKFLVAAFLLCFVHLYAQIDTVSNLSDSEKIYGLSLIWKEASYNFAYFDKTKINWDSAYRSLLPQILKTKNTYEYYRILQRFLALLKDGHTGIYRWPPYIQKKDINNNDIGIEYIDDTVIVTSIPKSQSRVIPLGSELIKVNEVPLSDFLTEQVFPYISYSAPHQLFSTATNKILVPPFSWDNKPVKLTLKTPDGKIVNYESRTNTAPQESVSVPMTRIMSFFQKLTDSIAYLQLFNFKDSSIILNFIKHLPELYSAKGIILDLRYNGGGNSEIGEAILKYFTNQKKIKRGSWKTPDNIAAFKAWGISFKPEDTLTMNAENKELLRSYFKVAKGDYWFAKQDYFDNDLSARRIKSPLIVLIGQNTGSAAEDFLISLDDIKGRATTIGERTTGSTGQPLLFELPGGGQARICTLRETYPDGREFVGIGIKPDIEVKTTIPDVLSGKDAALEKAIEIMKGRLNQKRIK